MKQSLKVGDLVKTPDGHTGRIEKIAKNFGRDRAGREIKDPFCFVESPKPGSPVVWWPASALAKIRPDARPELSTIKATLEAGKLERANLLILAYLGWEKVGYPGSRYESHDWRTPTGEIIDCEYGGLPDVIENTDDCIAQLYKNRTSDTISIMWLSNKWNVHVNSISSRLSDHWMAAHENLTMALVLAWLDHEERITSR